MTTWNEANPGPRGADRDLTAETVRAELAKCERNTNDHRLWSGVLSHVLGGGWARVRHGWVETGWGERHV